MSEESDQYLQAAHSEGHLDSSGHFTIDRADMLEKLSRFQLPDASFYILKLVQSAIAGGCSVIHIDTAGWGGQLRMTFDGRGYTGDELINLHSFLLEDCPAQRHLHHLAVGISSARSSGINAWAIHSHTASLRLAADGSLKWKPSADTTNSIILEWPTSARNVSELAGQLLSHLDVRLGGLFSRESAALNSRATVAPIPIALNGGGVNRHPGMPLLPTSTYPDPLKLEMGAAEEADGFSFFLAPGERSAQFCAASHITGNGLSWWAGELLDENSWQKLTPHVVSPWIPGMGRPTHQVSVPEHELPYLSYASHPALGCSAAIQVCPRTTPDRAILTLIQDGVSWEVEHPPELKVGHKYWASAAGLQADISEFRVVKNEAYQSLLAALKRLQEVTWPR